MVRPTGFEPPSADADLKKTNGSLFNFMVHPTGFEPVAPRLGI
jgi:hypothetical protein